MRPERRKRDGFTSDATCLSELPERRLCVCSCAGEQASGRTGGGTNRSCELASHRDAHSALPSARTDTRVCLVCPSHATLCALVSVGRPAVLPQLLALRHRPAATTDPITTRPTGPHWGRQGHRERRGGERRKQKGKDEVEKINFTLCPLYSACPLSACTLSPSFLHSPLRGVITAPTCTP